MDQQEQLGQVPHHMVSNADGTYSIVSHPKDEICDFCIAAERGEMLCAAKKDIYEVVRRLAVRIIRNDSAVKRTYNMHNLLQRQSA
jgi:hypothetical protein